MYKALFSLKRCSETIKMCAIRDIYMTTLLNVIMILQNGHGYEIGPPWETCLTMFPKHDGSQRQTSPCPFQMTANTTRYSPSETIQLTVSGISGQRLTGIQIRARPKHGDLERIVGEFIEWPTNKTQVFDCFGGKNNMIGHKNSVPVAFVDMKWTAPNVSVGDIEFVISYVKDFATFWVNEIVELSASVSVTVSPVEQIIDWSECGKSKGCFLYPRTCSGRDCYAGVTYKTINNSVKIEMFSSQEGYVSVGFSDDKRMGKDEIIACTNYEAGPDIQRGYNHIGLYTERQLRHGLFDMQGTYKDGRLYCRFKRPLLMSVFITKGHKAMKQYDLTKEYYLMLAWGPIKDGTDVITIHKELPPITDRKVSLQENDVVRGSSLPIAKQIHGALMLIGWIWLIGIATIVARYFKDGFNNRFICGSKVWFQIHRTLVIITWLLTVASFVLIFVVMGQLTENAVNHSYLGITVMSASTLQIAIGFLRPKPDSKVRPIFNWGHWFLGRSTIIIAVVTNFSAFNSDMIPQPQTYFANIVLGVYFGQQLLWEIWFEINRQLKQRKSSESYDVKNVSNKANGPSSVKKSVVASPVTSLVLYIICIMTMSAAALAAVFIF